MQYFQRFLKKFMPITIIAGIMCSTSPAMAAFCGLGSIPVACVADGLVCLNESAGLWACKGSSAKGTDGRCKTVTTYDVYVGNSSTSIGYFKACETAQYSQSGATRYAACESGATAYQVDVTLDNTTTFKAYGCCGSGTSKTNETIPNLTTPRGTRTTTTSGQTFTGVKYKKTSAMFESEAGTRSCTSNATSTYSCTCNEGFKVQNQGTSSCNCDAYASGYSCYVKSCTGTRQGATTTFVGNHYISDDRKSCAACPTGTESTISAANKIYYSGGTGPVVWTGRVGEQISNSAFTKIGVTSCYQPTGSASTPNSFQDGNGNTFTLSSNCNYTE